MTYSREETVSGQSVDSPGEGSRELDVKWKYAGSSSEFNSNFPNE
jgi:hypothetical protein